MGEGSKSNLPLNKECVPAMIPWQMLDSTQVPGPQGRGDALQLYQRGDEFSIRVGRRELMNSRLHGSEEALAQMACGRIANRINARVLIGGLGMGYTTAAALANLASDAEVVVAELAPAVVTWNRGPLADLAKRPLDDRRVTLHQGDVAKLLRVGVGTYDAILLDVDNGPEGLTQRGNDWLYAKAGLAAARLALHPGGVLGVWSATANASFAARLRGANLQVEEHAVRARQEGKGARHTIWLATRHGRQTRACR